MKKLYLFLLALMCSVSMAWGETSTIDFESATSTYTDWTFNNMTSEQTNSNVPAHGGSKFGTTGGKTTAYVVTTNKITTPESITFYISKTTTNTTASNWKVQVSTNNSSWTDVKTQAAGSVTRGEWTEVTQSLSAYSDVYVRVYYDGGSSTAVRCIDDLTLTYSAATKTETTLSFGTDSKQTLDATIGVPFTKPTLTADPTSILNAVTYTSSNTDVVRVANDGTITLVARGTAKITANYAGDATYKPSSDYYSIRVTDPNYSEVEIAAFTLVFKDWDDTTDKNGSPANTVGDNGTAWQKTSNLSDVFEEGAAHVSALNTVTRVYAARVGYGSKFASSSNTGEFTFTLANADQKAYSKIVINAAAYDDNAVTVTINGTGLNIAESHNKELMDLVYEPDGVVSQVSITAASGKRFFVKSITFYEVVEGQKITVTNAGYATYAPKTDVIVPDDNVVYYASEISYDAITFTALTKGTKVAAGEGLLIKGEGSHAFVKTNDATALPSNELIGVLESTDLSTVENAYVLALDNGVAAFCPVSGGSLAAGKAYLVRPAAPAGAPSVMRITFETEETETATDIENIEAEQTVKFIENGQLIIIKNGVRYNALGQAVR